MNNNIVLAERDRLRELERRARIARFEVEEQRRNRDNIDDDIDDYQFPGARAIQATGTDRFGYMRRRIRIGIQNMANNRNRAEPQESERAPNLPPVPYHQRTSTNDADVSEPPQCRICLSDVNDEKSEQGKLFAPCQCKGSVGLVHRKCLDRWRTLSTNPRSYFSCDQCKYTYNLERTDYAKWFERAELPNIFAVLATFMLALSIGGVLRFISITLVQFFTFLGKYFPFIANWFRRNGQYFYIENVFYRAVHYHPAWRLEHVRLRSDFRHQNRRGLGKIMNWPKIIETFPALPARLDILVGGIFTLGTIFFLFHNITQFRRDFRNHAERVGPSILFLVAGSGGRGLRIPVVVGLVYSYAMSHEFARVKCKELLFKFGEIVMEVSRDQ